MPEETTSVAPAPPAGAEAESPPPSGRMRILTRLALLAGLFGVGMWLTWPKAADPGDDKEEDTPVAAKPRETPKASPAEVLARGDNALRQLRYADALSHYKELLGRGAEPTAEITYRLGLIHEASGHPKEAITSYRQAIGKTASPAVSLACHLATSRCLLRQSKPAEARRLLLPILLNERRHEKLPQAFAIDVGYLVALSLACENAAPPDGCILEDRLISFGSIPLEPRTFLDEIAASLAPRREPSTVPIPVPLAIQKPTKSEPAIVLCAERAGSAKELLEQLARDADLKVEWSTHAQRLIADRTLDLHLHNWELRDVLQHAADCFGLVAVIDEQRVRFEVSSQSSVASAIQNDLAKRALHQALRSDPAHPYVAAILLELGNCEARQARRTGASAWYHRLARDITYSPLVAPAYFNLARLDERAGDTAQARKNYFRAIDQSPGHEFALYSRIRIGQLYLYEDEARQAIAHLQQAHAFAKGSPHEPLATLALAAALLHDEQIDVARKVITQHQAALQQEPFVATASFLDRYLNYRLAKRAGEAAIVKREAGRLIDVLWRNKDDSRLGAYGQLLIARAYHELEFVDQAELAARQALAAAWGPLKQSAEYQLATTIAERKDAEAAEILEKLVEQESPYRERARFQLARIDLAQRKFQPCADKCRQIWQDGRFADRPALLRLWGTALEGAGELAKAAQCYAGKAPD